MYCASCGQSVKDGARFCENCGSPLQESEAVISYAPEAPARQRRGSRDTGDPYKDQIAALKLEIRQLKLELKQITTNMSNTRAQHYETAAFVPEGLLRRGYKWFEDFKLLGPQQQKQHLQQEIMDLEQQLLGLQQAQMKWKTARRG
ncbi:MAG TPA: zinc-ribbon domain-containing protein [Ktedonobacteraceae bacterium]|jgi:predicted amidophosphoribosyltransferase|nr:zinc-ribbon domain-containing protein [Ktedonobacteraceae bacterium]